MDKLVAFFKNVWFRRSIAVVCWGYTALLCWVAWLTFGYCFEYENATSLFVLYLFVNIAALGLMILTRKQVITMVNCMILPPIVFLILIFGFGNWYLIFPPLAVVAAMFFINASNETLKTVLGTLYLLMYVIGVAAYVAISLFIGGISFISDSSSSLDLSLRDYDYEVLSSSGEYRVVRYVDEPGERRTASYYVEYTGDDVELPFAVCKKVFGCKHVHTASYSGKSDDPISWEMATVNGVEAEVLVVDGRLRENPYLIEEISETEESSDVIEFITDEAEVSSEEEKSDESAQPSEESSQTAD